MQMQTPPRTERVRFRVKRSALPLSGDRGETQFLLAITLRQELLLSGKRR